MATVNENDTDETMMMVMMDADDEEKEEAIPCDCLWFYSRLSGEE